MNTCATAGSDRSSRRLPLEAASTDNQRVDCQAHQSPNGRSPGEAQCLSEEGLLNGCFGVVVLPAAVPFPPLLVEQLRRHPATHVRAGGPGRCTATARAGGAVGEAHGQAVADAPRSVLACGVQNPTVVPGHVAQLQGVVLHDGRRQEPSKLPAPERRQKPLQEAEGAPVRAHDVLQRAHLPAHGRERYPGMHRPEVRVRVGQSHGFIVAVPVRLRVTRVFGEATVHEKAKLLATRQLLRSSPQPAVPATHEGCHERVKLMHIESEAHLLLAIFAAEGPTAVRQQQAAEACGHALDLCGSQESARDDLPIAAKGTQVLLQDVRLRPTSIPSRAHIVGDSGCGKEPRQRQQQGRGPAHAAASVGRTRLGARTQDDPGSAQQL
eukprot:CAMPEP_0175664400 /NCGR_PEP_ID=MMETSP0097-20121207/16509_1 /TAXON_ID=311494 /ORGANISM="Alexandrium monilatum, Strain CCMP3105" /LENGTH=380 /DNA_ID=CAMNT_0016970711 /DNA_START=142 /DNA_END=1281 /DNA_ORIENTATION=+